jgi:hypothetical protein
MSRTIPERLANKGRWMKVDDVPAGAWFLSDLYERVDGNLVLMVTPDDLDVFVVFAQPTQTHLNSKIPDGAIVARLRVNKGSGGNTMSYYAPRGESFVIAWE